MFKRLFDIAVSVVVLLTFSPVFIVLMLLVRVKLGSPVFFTQERPGLYGKPFRLIKLRTMLEAYDSFGNPLPNEQRYTKFGNLLRSSSLDELPALWNVLKGEMSLVGPRPLLMDYLPLYTPEQAKRHNVRPGITGWAQVNGRNAISWEEKFKLDVWYVDNQSLWLDIKILFLTVKKVFIREGITPDHSMVTPRFTGKVNKELQRRYVLRKIEEKDLPTRVEWLNDPSIYQTVNIQVPVLMENTLQWFKKVKSNSARADLVLERDGEIVAMSGLTNIVGGISEGYTFVHPDLKGQGIGTISHFMRALYGFQFLKLKAIKTIIDEDNFASRRVVEKVGYYIDGSKEDDKKHNGEIKNRYYYSCTPQSLKSNLHRYKILSENQIELIVFDKP